MAFDILVDDEPIQCADWTQEFDHDGVTYYNFSNWFNCYDGQELNIIGGTVFGWPDGGPFLRAGWHKKIYTGLPPNTIVGIRAEMTWLIQGEWCEQFISGEGDPGDIVDISVPHGGYNFWTIDGVQAGGTTRESIGYVKTSAAGELTFKWGMRNARPSTSQHAFINRIQIVKFKPSMIQGYVQTVRKHF